MQAFYKNWQVNPISKLTKELALQHEFYQDNKFQLL